MCEKEMQKTRLHYVDIAKGLLILMVIIHHIPQYYLTNGHNVYLKYLDDYSFIYTSFFMSSFFILSGHVSNFSKPFIAFTIKNFKSLMVPSFTFTMISVWSKSPLDVLQPISLDTILYMITWGGQFWFLPAMFLGREIYWVINHYIDNTVIRWLIFLMLLVFGVVLSNNIDIMNIWRFKHALIFTVFLAIGQFTKFHGISSNKIIVLGFTYLLFLLACLLIGIDVPTITQNVNLNIFSIPLCLLLSISGTALIVYISYLINRNSFFEYLGKESIIFYIVHPICLPFAVKIFSPILNFNAFGVFLFYVICLISCLMGGYFVIILFNRIHLNFLLGK